MGPHQGVEAFDTEDRPAERVRVVAPAGVVVPVRQDPPREFGLDPRDQRPECPPGGLPGLLVEILGPRSHRAAPVDQCPIGATAELDEPTDGYG